VPADQKSAQREVRTRFAPSPTGDLHVGNIRTALFDWAYARHTGGKLLFRIEDTDRERVTDEYIQRAIETLQWLGLNWDEGPEVGGPYGPYLQSQRLDIYNEWAQKFLQNGDAYNCYCSTEELEARREKQRELNQAPGYDGKCRSLSADEISRYQAEGRKPVIRMRMPDGETRFTDLIRGEVTFDHKFVPDFVLMRADGSPLYTLAVAVDDVLMKVTHVLRGDLGWSPGDDRENITMEELVQLFTVERVNSSPARFDMKKLEAINGDKIRALTIDDFLTRALPFLLKDGVIQGSDAEIAVVKSALPIIQERIARMNEVTAMLKFLFVEKVTFDAESSSKVGEEPSQHVIKRALEVLQPLGEWKHDLIEAELRKALLDEMGLKPRVAFGPVRIAVTGSHISPPLFESMELLGKERSIARLTAAIR